MSRVKSRMRVSSTSLAVVLAMSLSLGMTSAIASPPVGSIGDTVPGADPTCVQDVDGDGYVGFQDVVGVLYDWGECPVVPPPKNPGFDDDTGQAGAARSLELLPESLLREDVLEPRSQDLPLLVDGCERHSPLLRVARGGIVAPSRPR